MVKKRGKIATFKNPTIEAVINELYYFSSEQQAIERMKVIRDNFVTSREQDKTRQPSVKLWIKGFEVSAEDKKDGFLGQFALIYPKKAKEQWTLTAEKLDTPLENHPQKKRPTFKQPDWGHPIMRAVKNQKRYETIEEVQAELAELHKQFPDVTIPNVNKLHVIVYERREGEKNPTRKYTIELKSDEEGKFYMLAKENTGPKRRKPFVTEGKEAQGFFTARALLKKKPAPGPTEATDS